MALETEAHKINQQAKCPKQNRLWKKNPNPFSVDSYLGGCKYPY